MTYTSSLDIPVSAPPENDSTSIIANYESEKSICNDRILRPLKLTIMTIALMMTTSTLMMIVSHRQLRQKHNIFPFNIVLADMVFIVAHFFMETMFDDTTKVQRIIVLSYK